LLAVPPEDALAVLADEIAPVDDDAVSPRPAAHDVESTVTSLDAVIAVAAEEPVPTRSAPESVGAAEATEEFVRGNSREPVGAGGSGARAARLPVG
jgi:hypothetical protein